MVWSAGYDWFHAEGQILSLEESICFFFVFFLYIFFFGLCQNSPENCLKISVTYQNIFAVKPDSKIVRFLCCTYQHVLLLISGLGLCLLATDTA